MVHIINGEIVPDSDPRVQKRRHAEQPSSQRIRGVDRSSAAASSAQNRNRNARPAMSLDTMLGIEGMVTIPAIPVLKLPPKEIQKIYLVLAGIVILLFGWRSILFFIVAYYISHQQSSA